MVNLFFEIKRNAPKEFQSTLKISSPDLVDALINLYRNHPDEALNRLIEVFFERSGKASLKEFKAAIKRKRPKRKTPADKKAANNSSANEANSGPDHKPRYYRGARIVS